MTIYSASKRPFWLSIRPAKKCLFSRRNGYIGYRLLGYSVCLRLFGADILTEKKSIPWKPRFIQFVDWLLRGRASEKAIFGCEGRGDGNVNDPYLTRYTLIKRSTWQLCIHVFHRSDYAEWHDHPWNFWTFILYGGYIENTPPLSKRFGVGVPFPPLKEHIKPGRRLYRDAQHTHYVELIQGPYGPRPAVTLVLMGARVRDWGFWTDGRFLPWQQYFQSRNC